MAEGRDPVARFIAHPAVVAVLSAGLAAGATWWLNEQASERAAQAAIRQETEALIVDYSTVTAAMAELYEEVSMASGAQDVSAVDIVEARRGLARAEAALGALEPIRWYRLSSYFEGKGAAAEDITTIKEALFGAFRGVTNCGRNIEHAVLHSETDSIAWVTRCSGMEPGEADAVGALRAVRRLNACLDAVMRSLDASIETPERLTALSTEVETECADRSGAAS